MEQQKYTPRGAAPIRFSSGEDEKPARTGQPSRSARKGRSSGSSSTSGNPERSGGAAARRAAAPTTGASDASTTVLLHCSCGWEKRVPMIKVINAFRGHYGYAHPQRKLPTDRECLAAVVLEDHSHCPTCGQPVPRK